MGLHERRCIIAKAVLILGRSGTGKSTSMRNFKDEELAVINVVGKELPFQSELKSVVATSDYEVIKQKILGTQKKTIVIDDAGYLITKQFMANHNKVGGGNAVFQLYNDMADQFWLLIDYIKNKLPAEKIVYIVMHEDYDERGGIKPKTIGKLLDEKVCIEGLFTIVLRSCINDGKYQFCTKNQGTDATKSPMGMFEEEYIDNDLAAVDKRIREYYKLTKEGEKNE